MKRSELMKLTWDTLVLPPLTWKQHQQIKRLLEYVIQGIPMTVYEVYEKQVGKYDPENPPSPPFSVWLSEQRADWLRENPKVVMCDGHIFHEADLQAFHAWVVARYA